MRLKGHFHKNAWQKWILIHDVEVELERKELSFSFSSPSHLSLHKQSF